MRASDRGKNSSMAPELLVSAQGLKGRQSVRTTFRLPEQTIKLLGLAAAQLGLKQKSLFDQLVEDRKILDLIAEQAGRMARAREGKNGKRRQKTFVLSRRSLEALDAVARQRQVPRDLLVEISISRLLPVITDEQEKHRKRIALHRELAELASRLSALERKAAKTLGRDDQAASLVREAARQCRTSNEKLAAIIRNGEDLEEFTLKTG